ncbi:MAG: hypothetical protein C0421_04175 [Hyphomonas sp.]|nr:hypothetical protein [Hyphomonas sp.]
MGCCLQREQQRVRGGRIRIDTHPCAAVQNAHHAATFAHGEFIQRVFCGAAGGQTDQQSGDRKSSPHAHAQPQPVHTPVSPAHLPAC